MGFAPSRVILVYPYPCLPLPCFGTSRLCWCLPQKVLHSVRLCCSYKSGAEVEVIQKLGKTGILLMEIGWLCWNEIREPRSTLLVHLGKNWYPGWRRIIRVNVSSFASVGDGARVHLWWSICGSVVLLRRLFSKAWQSALFQRVFLDVSTAEIMWNTGAKLKKYNFLRYSNRIWNMMWMAAFWAHLSGFLPLPPWWSSALQWLWCSWMSQPPLSQGIFSFRVREECSLLSNAAVACGWCSKPCHFDMTCKGSPV